MDLSQLFKLKEESLNLLTDSMSRMSFDTDEERNRYYNAAVDGIVTFYTLAMIRIIDNEVEKEKNAA